MLGKLTLLQFDVKLIVWKDLELLFQFLYMLLKGIFIGNYVV